jgi:hypothetical protein
MSLYIVIVTTFEDVFTRINEMRRLQCRKHNIPVLFVYNGKKPDGYTLQDDERVFPMEGHAPAMFLKFKQAIQEIYSIQGHTPDYILRCTARCFLNLDNVLRILQTLPKQQLLAGFQIETNDGPFMMGIFMLFSKDVAIQFAIEDNVQGAVLWHSDDCTISHTVSSYANFVKLNNLYTTLTGFYCKPVTIADIPTSLPELSEDVCMIRVKNGDDNATSIGQAMSIGEQIDITYWKLLMKKYEGIDLNIV